MKSFYIAISALSLFLFAGCESQVDTVDFPVRLGMSSDMLKRHFGEPLRIEAAPDGTGYWYYNFIAWKTDETHSSGYDSSFDQRSYSATVGLEMSRQTHERPIHLSADGFVIEPLPRGEVVR